MVLAGNVTGSHGYGFRPDEIKKGFVFTLRSVFAFRFGPAAHFCAKCFMVWSKDDPKDAVKFLQDFGNDDLKARLAALNASAKPDSEAPSLHLPPSQ